MMKTPLEIARDVLAARYETRGGKQYIVAAIRDGSWDHLDIIKNIVAGIEADRTRTAQCFRRFACRNYWIMRHHMVT